MTTSKTDVTVPADEAAPHAEALLVAVVDFVASHRGCSLRPFADRYGLSVAQTWTVLSVALRGDLVRDVSRDGRRFQLRVTDAGTALLGERVTR